MNVLLSIDTAVQNASVCLSRNDEYICEKTNPSQKDHAAWLHKAIKELLLENNYRLQDVSAIAVSAGPGSYTGLRVAMATAKGLCYALNIPLIQIGTLQMMANAAKNEPTDLLCPMIDARRLEVFTAVFDKTLTELIAPRNCIVTNESFQDLLAQHTITFFGNGSQKFKSLISHNNALFQDIKASARQMSDIAYQKFIAKDFSELAYSEPFYGKEFYSPAHQKMAENQAGFLKH